MHNCYEFINLRFSGGKTYNIGVHRLMAIMFIKIPKRYTKKGLTYKDLVVDHIDNVKYHNVIENLQWLTNRENIKKSYKYLMEEKNDLVTDKKDVKKICKDLQKGLPIYAVAEKYNVTETLVADIRYKRRWTEISDKYTFPSKVISNDDVEKICKLLMSGKSVEDISKEMNCSQGTIYRIKYGLTFQDITSKYDLEKTYSQHRLLTDDEVIQICELIMKNKRPAEISRMLNLDSKIIERIRKKESYKHITSNYTFDYSKIKYRVDDDIIHGVCKDISEHKLMLTEIAKKYNLSYTFIKAIKAGKHRKDISSQYVF